MLTETHLITITLIFILLSLPIYFMVKRDFAKSNQISYPTLVLIWIYYGLLLTLTVLGGMVDFWKYEEIELPSQILGLLLAVMGLTITVLSMYQFGSFSRISDLDQSQLITSGIYQYSRNPQNVGSILFCLGISLFFQSLYSLALTILYLIFFWIYAPLEEDHLEKLFGESYRNYKENTRRFL